MPQTWIKDFNNLAVTKEREAALQVVQVGLEAIDAE